MIFATVKDQQEQERLVKAINEAKKKLVSSSHSNQTHFSRETHKAYKEGIGYL